MMKWLLRLLGLKKTGLKVKPKNRKGEVWGYIHEAERLLGKKFDSDKVLWKWKFKKATHYPEGKPAISHPRHGLIAGGTSQGSGTIRTFVVYGADGLLGPKTGVTEALRGILTSHGIYGAKQNEKILETGWNWL